jgi:hypothetical protein
VSRAFLLEQIMPSAIKYMHACVQALEVHDVEKDIAAFIKKYFDGKYEPTWHCIVGQSFGEIRSSWLLNALTVNSLV